MNETTTKQNNTQIDNSQELLNLIQNIQSKLNDTNETQNNSQEYESTTDTNKENNCNDKNCNSNNFDFSSLLKNIDISQILGLFSNNSQSSNEAKENTGLNIDASTIFKIQKVMSKLNGPNPKKNLLLSLKPFLRKSRQEKLNEYISMLTIVDALEVFSSKGSDDNVWLQSILQYILQKVRA